MDLEKTGKNNLAFEEDDDDTKYSLYVDTWKLIKLIV